MALNCWEYFECGLRKDGPTEEDVDHCPAPIATLVNGLNGGRNGGRVCWAISGSFCRGHIHGFFSKKLGSCLECDFFKLVKKEEGPDFKMLMPSQPKW